MNIPAATQTGGTTDPSTSSSSTPGQVMSDTFLQLLVAQLQSQSPLDPVDPNQFIGQLAQFNELSEVVRIREILEQVTSTTGGTSGGSPTNPVTGGH